MKITIYTINDCKFSQAEKEYLKSKNLPFEEKNLETNREFLTEMLTVSNNFAGTPVTKIEKDDGTSVVLKGYTQSEVDAALGLSTDATSAPVTPAPEVKTEAPAEAQTTLATPEVKPEETVAAMPVAPDQVSVPGSAALNTPTQADMSMPSATTEPAPAMPAATDPSVVSQPVTPVVEAPAPAAPSSFDAMSAPQGAPVPAEQPGVIDTTAQTPPEPPPAAPPAPVTDPLNSVLNDLQNKGTNGNP